MKRVGVIGGGQLAWMMGDAAKKLGVELVVQTPSVQDPAVSIAVDTVFAPVDDARATSELAKKCDVITFENEFVNLEALSLLARLGICFRPSLEALSPLLDKYHQRCYLQELGLPVPKFFAPTPSVPHSLCQLGFPLVLKARRHGYDGQGTFIIEDDDSLREKLQGLGQDNFLWEEFIPFEREIAVIAARSLTGEVTIYPVVETQQEQQVCRRVIAPANLQPKQVEEIEQIAHTILSSLAAVGVFGIELFLIGDRLLVNEIAPRTHNSGHFSLDACKTSQFEQHLRAVCGLPLGETDLICQSAVMVNLLGYENAHSDYTTKRSLIAQIPRSHIHWYGKESRPGRKLGHVTVLLSHLDYDWASAIAQTIESIWYPHP
ncbi:5-(carboxyamino)imidazole ribonucleotide synthase [Iningainema tapete]|uniref:N5-carboxyaminoimidazole ribonucleotide synthase n=1 Tax=Iningainema tapete BLCC-T55 TaxID=2748662 RepID=A0A8J7C923_9CYAN|nr:5-(carboxyamino)imidazole ribonucleotide synthase [Iningainema tapete]MBD2777584.1 5-(carboxyamino)imidazole ribonucleotide synthase [Iningainema tapete BLCC-T55]